MTVAKRLAAVCVVVAVLGGVASAWPGTRASASQRASLVVLRVTSTPEGKGALSSRHLNVVIATSKLSFRVALANHAMRRRLKVTVTVTRPRSSQGPLVKSKTVWLGPTRAGAVKLGPFMPVLFAQRARVKVAVSDQRSRETWTTAYPVIFALG